MADQDRIYRPVQDIDAEHKPQARKAVKDALSLERGCSNTFLGRKTHEPFPMEDQE